MEKNENGFVNRIKKIFGISKENITQEDTVTRPDRTNFIEQHPTVKTQEELKSEAQKRELEVHYSIKGKDYIIPGFHEYMGKMKENDVKVLLQKIGEGKYLIREDQMSQEEIYEMLCFMMKYSGYRVFVPINLFFSENKFETERIEKDSVARTIDFHEYFAKRIHDDGDTDKSITILKEEMVRLIEYKDKFNQWVQKIEQEMQK